MATRFGGAGASRLCTLALVGGVSLAMTRGACAQHRYQSWLTERFAGDISDTEIMKAFRDRLGGSYQNLQAMFSSCGSEGFVHEAARLLPGTGDYSVAVSRQFKRCEWVDIDVDQVRNGKTGLTVRPDPALYMHGWYAQYFRGIQLDATRTAEQLKQFAVDNDFRGPNKGSQIWGTNDGLMATIGDGAQGRRAAMWHTYGDGFQVKTVDQILRANGYTNETIDWAYSSRGGQMVQGVPIDLDGDRNTLMGPTGLIELMRTYLRAEMGQRKAFFSFSSHGTYGNRKAEKKENPQPNQPRQGRQYTPGSAMNLEFDLDDEVFIPGFFEGFRTDDPNLEAAAGDRPMFLLTTSEEDYAGPVDVFIDDVAIGSFAMLGSTLGASYRFDLSDDAWSGLYDAHVLDDFLMIISFDFGPGSFRVATDWDQDLFDLDNFGIQIRGPGIITVPASGAAALLALAAGTAVRRRRRCE